MFDNIVIYRNNQTSGPLIDKGLLAEALLFYGNVHLLLNRGTLATLWTALGPDGVDQLLERPEVRVSYMSQNFGTLGATTGGLRSYNYGVIEIGSNTKRKLSKQEELEQILERTLGKSEITRKRVNRLISAMSFPRIEDDMSPDQFTNGARDDLNDPRFVQDAIASALESLLPGDLLP